MSFITMDMELADRMFPSIVSIALIEWEGPHIISTYSTLVNPEFEIEEFMTAHHKINNEDIKNAPVFRDIIPDICGFIKNKKVFTFYGNRNIKYLADCFETESKRLPNFQFASVQSICNRVWPDTLKNKKLPNVKEALNIDGISNNALNDARTMGIIINKALQEDKVQDTDDLFHKAGYAGGFVIGNSIYLYRAVKINKKYQTEDYIYDMKLTFETA